MTGKKYAPFFYFFFCTTITVPNLHAQGTLQKNLQQFSSETFEQASENTVYPYNKKRIRAVAAANIAAYSGSMIALSTLWYSNQPRTSFHFFNDNKQWLQMDKAGHMYTAWKISTASMEMWRWAGLPREKRIFWGAIGGVGFQSIIEIMDGFAADYGFSVGDFVANMLGSALFTAQELAWDQQKIQLKFSVHSKVYNDQALQNRTEDLYGKTAIERFLKDYNGQTYWASANINSFIPDSKLPDWLNISVGYGAAGMFGGITNIARDDEGNISFDRRDIERYRQWYLAPDVDLTRIPTNKKGVKILLFVLNSFKFPAPALEFSQGKIKGKWIAF